MRLTTCAVHPPPTAVEVDAPPTTVIVRTVEDYERLAESLRAAVAEPLPRLDDPRLAVLTDRARLDLVPRGAPLDERLDASLRLVEAAKSVLRAYVIKTQDDPSYMREWLAVFDLVLGVTRIMWSLSDELWSSLDDPDPSMLARLEGRRDLQRGTQEMLGRTVSGGARNAAAATGSRAATARA